MWMIILWKHVGASTWQRTMFGFYFLHFIKRTCTLICAHPSQYSVLVIRPSQCPCQIEVEHLVVFITSILINLKKKQINAKLIPKCIPLQYKLSDINTILNFTNCVMEKNSRIGRGGETLFLPYRLTHQ